MAMHWNLDFQISLFSLSCAYIFKKIQQVSVFVEGQKEKDKFLQ